MTAFVVMRARAVTRGDGSDLSNGKRRESGGMGGIRFQCIGVREL